MKCSSDLFDSVVAEVAGFLHDAKTENTPLAVALSGGADSVCLLRAIRTIRQNVSAIHVHHGIRGHEADADETFCEALCNELDVSLTIYHVNVPAYSKEHHMSLETAARRLRYECFDAYLNAHPDAYIATAHQANDNAETILFRMARGTGLRGLCGIPAVRERYIRPCLGLTADTLRRALEERGYAYRNDSTNQDNGYTRNYIRHTLLPAFENVHESAVNNISLMTEGLKEDEAYLSDVARVVLKNAESATLRRAIAGQASPIAKRMLQKLYEQVRVSDDAMTAQQMTSALDLIRCGEHHARLTMPGGIELVLEGDTLSFEMTRDMPSLLSQALVWGANKIETTGDCFILSDTPITKEKFSELNIYKLLIQSRIYFDTIDLNLFIRAKQDGDAYRYGEMTHRLKKLFNDKKLTRAARATRPVLCDKEGILWVPGFGVRDGSEKKSDEKQHCIFVCYCSMTEASNDFGS